MGVIKPFLYLCVCLVGFFNVCFTSFQLAELLSGQVPWQIIKAEQLDTHAFLGPLLYDILLVLVFVAQHSFMATDWWKAVLDDFDLQPITRSIYCIATSITLQWLMGNWRPLPATPLWWIHTHNSNALWLFFFLVHVMAWILIYSSALTMDFAELTGLKQVYYYMQGWEAPLSYKSHGVQRLYSHMRHPGVWCFLIILWVHPLMTLGRFVLALMWTLYLLFGHTVDVQDYEYVEYQVTTKKFEIERRIDVVG